MKTALLRTLTLLLVATRCLAADDAAEKTISKTFTVEPGGEISVDADEGDIEVAVGTLDTVQVTVEREVSGGSESQRRATLKANKVTFAQEGKEVRIVSASPKNSFSLFGRPNLSVHFRITVPKRFDATLNTAGGNIRVADLNGAVEARTSGGDLKFEKIEGPVDGRTSGGNVKASGCTDKMQLQTSGGNIVIKDYTGPSAQADTSGGNIEAANCAGKLQVKTSGGNINIGKFSGASAYADTSGGSVFIEVTKQPEGDCNLRTSGGNITASLPADIAVNLNASTDGGEVTSDLPVTVQGKARPGKLEGKINSGGPAFTLRTSGGDIRLQKQ
jgi:DUF4097 and DUF4098 domain-containing protein YvlB